MTGAPLAHSDEEGLRLGHAPMAHGVICVDFDGTIYPWAPLMAEPAPVPGAAEALRRFRDYGYTIVIFTSRLSPTWLTEAGETAADQRAHIEKLLHRDGIPHDGITAEKIPAEFYVDDRAVRFHDNWREITHLILWSRDAP